MKGTYFFLENIVMYQKFRNMLATKHYSHYHHSPECSEMVFKTLFLSRLKLVHNSLVPPPF